MASPSYTYTLTNGTSADASQVMQNLNDLLNGITDGTKDISVSALTAAGVATLNGNVILGSASSDDLTVNAALASSIPVKTTFSYDLGANATGLKYIFLGSADSAARSTKLAGATIASAYTFTLPTSGGTSRYVLETNGSGTTSWVAQQSTPMHLSNVSLACSVSGNALTIALKGADGNDPSSSNPIDIAFRSSTAATGTYTKRTVTSALSVTVSSGSTLGTTDNNPHYLYVYALDNSGTVELAVSSTPFDEGTLASTTAEGGGGGADSFNVLYSTTLRSSVPIRLLGRLSSTQTTAGTWAVVPTEIALPPFYNQIATKWATFNPTGGWNTNVTYSGKYRRVGDTLECMVLLSCSGTPNSATLSVNIPFGLTIDTTKLISTATPTPVGQCEGYDDSASSQWAGIVEYSSTTSVYCRYFVATAASNAATLLTVNDTNPQTFANLDRVYLRFSVPITSW